MSRHHFVGGRVIVNTARFAFEDVLDAYMRIIDALTAQFGLDGSTVTTNRAGFQALKDWSADGKANACQVWRGIREEYDVADEALIHTIGPLTVKAYLLGKTWSVYRSEDDALLTSHLEPIGRLDPAPVICLYGEQTEKGFGLLPESTLREGFQVAADAVGGKLTFLVHTHRCEEGIVRGHVGWMTLPHVYYGDGTGPSLVRCVLPDGSEVPPQLTQVH